MDQKKYNVMRSIENVVATMAIEDMYLDDDFIRELYKVGMGEKTSQELLDEVIGQYARQ